jgi:ABC-type branched-subunit amino acid transport system substrate-binding protein
MRPGRTPRPLPYGAAVNRHGYSRPLMRVRLVIVVCAAVATVVAGCGGSDDSTADRPPAFKLRIVDLVPLSGDLSVLGVSGRKAADLAARQIQDATRRLGASQSVEIVHVDDPGDPNAAVAKTKEQLGSGGAGCITGSWTTGPTLAVLNQVAIPQGILQISPAATADVLSEASDRGLLDRTVLRDSNQGTALADLIEEDVGGADGREVAVAFEENTYGTGLANAFMKAWRAKRGVIVGPASYDPRATSYDHVVNKIGTSNVEAYAVFGFAAGYQKLAGPLIRGGRWDSNRTYVPDALAARLLPRGAGTELTEGLRGTAPGAPEGSPATEAFARLFASAGGPKRQAFAAQVFDAVVLCYLSAVRAGRADGRAMASVVRQVSGPPGAKYTWQQLPEAVRAIEQGREVDYQGASGPLDLNAAGDPTAGVYDLFRFRNGKLQVYGQAPVGSVAAP